MSINHDSYVYFYALVGSAQCWGIKILTIGDFNSFGFFGTPCIGEQLYNLLSDASLCKV